MAVIKMAGHRGKAKTKYSNVLTLACLHCGCDLVVEGRCRACKSDDLHRFDSKAEHKRYCELLVLLRHGKIRELIVQPSFVIEIEGETVGKYIADFSYIEGDRRIVEDVKGGSATDTPLSKFKRKCVHAIYGIEVAVVRR